MARVYPEDIAPREYLEPDTPDSEKAFEPASNDPGADPGPIPQPTPPPASEPPPVRPEVEYTGQGGSHIYTLLFPLSINGVERNHVVINHPSLWDVQDWASSRLPTNYQLVARMVGMSPVDLGALKWPDISAIMDIATTMLPDEIKDAIAATKAVKGDGNT
jgi:hypothetical protein